MATYHKAPREYLGIAVPRIEALVRRGASGRPAAFALAAGLWDNNVHEARLAAAKLLTQPDPRARLFVLTEIPLGPELRRLGLADHACKAAERRIVADPRPPRCRRNLDPDPTRGSAAPPSSPPCPGQG